MSNEQSNILRFLILCFIFSACFNKEEVTLEPENWAMLPFVKVDSLNPILNPDPEQKFFCPVRQDTVRWELKDVFNPAAVVRDGKVYMIYRAEDTLGIYNGTSRLGLAISEDGLHFKKEAEPVFYPDNDELKIYEWEGGCEDPRIVESEAGAYIMTYTTYDGKIPRLCLATSADLLNWNKQGLVLNEEKYIDLWTKSGSIVAKRIGERFIAQKINNRYWMYFGDKNIHAATSEDLIHWKPVAEENGDLKIVFGPRKGSWDSDLVEPGPPALITDKGILLIYNSRNVQAEGTTDLPENTYTAGQILFSVDDPLKVIARTDEYFFKPEKDYEISGQVGNVCFLEGLVFFKGQWFLYYGTADSKIAVATYIPNNQ